MDTLFTKNTGLHAPLADTLRPTDFVSYVGQEDLVGRDSVLRAALERDDVPSMILWGPPGCGKTTLAMIIANVTQSSFIQISAVSSGKKDLMKIIDDAKASNEFYQKKTIVFVDEIHRWNKAQQDALLPYVENGILTLIGATTENPSFEINSALLSRCQVFVLKQLNDEHMLNILQRAAAHAKKDIPTEVLEEIIQLSNGDARSGLNTLEFAMHSGKTITPELVRESIQKTQLYDKSGEQHFNMISALHKSMRASDPSASLYWLARMLEGGEDPLYVARRVVRFASEDVGNAKPTGLVLATAAFDACHTLGMPECALALAQAVDYLARAPKSRALDDAWHAIAEDIRNYPNEPVPMHLRNAPTQLMKDVGYGTREQESNLPANLADKTYI